MNRKTINNTHNVNLYLCICIFVEDACLDLWWAVDPADSSMELSGPQSGRDFRVGRHSVCVTCLGNIIASTKFVPICLSAVLPSRFLAFCVISIDFVAFVYLFLYISICCIRSLFAYLVCFCIVWRRNRQRSLLLKPASWLYFPFCLLVLSSSHLIMWLAGLGSTGNSSDAPLPPLAS